MASNKFYAYYLRGNKIALIEEDISDNNRWKSPAEAITDGLEIEYSYSPKFHLPDIIAWSDSNSNVTKLHYNGWTSVGGYLTLLRSGTTWTTFSKFDVGDTILIDGSSRWNGIHKIQEIQSYGDVTHGGIKTYTKVGDNIPSVVDSSVTWTTDETITSMAIFMMETAFTDSDTTPYIWIMGSATSANNGGLFSGWSFSSTTLTLSGGTRYMFSSNLTTADEQVVGTDVAMVADVGEDIYIYKAFRERGAFMITDVDALSDENDNIDLPDYLAKALVYYVKARSSEDRGDIDMKEYFMKQFREMVEKQESTKIWGMRRIGPGPNAIK